MEACKCRAVLRHSFASVREAVYEAAEMDVIIANSELLTQSNEKWLRLYRCRSCGTEWVEACYSSGHMDFYYLFPAPPNADSTCWLHEEATALPPS